MHRRNALLGIFWGLAALSSPAAFAQGTVGDIGKNYEIPSFPEFIYSLLPPPVVSGTAAQAPVQTIPNYVDQFTYGTCAPSPQHCDLDGVVNSDNKTYRLNWICEGYPGGCTITKNKKPLMSVGGTGFLDDLPIASSADEVVFDLAAVGDSCTDRWSFVPPPGAGPPAPAPSSACPNTNQQTITSHFTKFSNNKLISGFFPRFHFVADSNGTVSMSATVSQFLGGPCLSPQFRAYLTDGPIQITDFINGVVGSPMALPPLSVTGGSVHNLQLNILTNCAAGPVESLADLGDVSFTLSGPLGPYCPITQTASSLSVTYNNNLLSSGSLPLISFTPATNERVTATVSVGGFVGGACLTPAYRIHLYDNGNPMPTGLPVQDTVDGINGGWSWTWPDFIDTAPGSHVIQVGAETNCTSGTFQSTLTLNNISLNVTRNPQ